MNKIKSFNILLLLIASILTLYLIFYLSKPWYYGPHGWFHLLSYFIWALLPYAILFWLSVKRARSILQALITLMFILVIILISAITYTYALIVEFHPHFNIEMLLIPLCQFIISLIAFPVVDLFRKKSQFSS